MADYHRFVSYIYLYERGIKTMNTGFAKVESRAGQCRVNITMKNMYHESNVKFSAYMFVRDSGKLLGIYMGDLNTQNNTGEFSCVTDSGNIEGSGYSLDDVRGMIIRGENGKVYGTGWDDEALAVDRFIPIGEASLNKDNNLPEESYLPEKASMSESESLTGKNDLPEETDLPEESSPSKETALPGKASLPEENSQPRKTNLPEENRRPGEMGLQGEASLTEQENSGQPKELTAESVGGAAAARVLEGGMDIPLDAVPEAEKDESQGASCVDTAVLERILDRGMRMYPFEDDQVTACIRMEPQDIGMLPMQYWRLASNSFLLHGYYSYRHLIMAQKNDGTYIFGIPGVNYERERFMAGMFGFDKFKPVRSRASGGNEFGYWYMELI